MNIYDVLHDVQQKLKAPKNQYNSFGKYKYRSCEDILEAVKKLLPEGVCLTMEDGVEEYAGRVFLKSTAILSSPEVVKGGIGGTYNSAVSSTGCAEIALEQKGMQAAQVTGSASSYARKYALNGLFCIDDTKDADSQDNTSKRVEPLREPLPPPEPLNQAQVKALEDGIDGCFTMDELKDKFTVICDHFKSGRLKKNDFDELTQFKDERKNTLTGVKK